MILRDILDEFQDLVDDPNYWNDTRGKALANRAIRNIAKELHIVFKAYYEFYTEDGRKQYDLPFNYIANHLLWFNEMFRPITFLDSPRSLYSLGVDDSVEGYPTHAYLWTIQSRDSLIFYPIPDDAYLMKWWYYCIAPKLVNNNDEPPLARNLHEFIIRYMELESSLKDEKISDIAFITLWNREVQLMKIAHSKADNLEETDKVADARDRFPDETVDLPIRATDDEVQW